ncbi:MAG TPA: glycosyltransferase [Gaiellaceae bacterium]|nr:glycosyltransferase [Gaiellaceae bacterium]
MSAKPLRILGVGNGRSINFLRWGRRLRERGHEVHLASDRFSDVPAELEGLEPHPIRELEPLLRVRGVRRLRFGPALRGLAHDLGVDLVHAHYMLPYGYWAARAGVHPFVLSPWGTDVLVHAQTRRRGRRWATKAIEEADYLVVNSDANERASIALGADPSRIRRIIWYAELDRFVAQAADPGLRARFGWPDDALVVLSLRNYRPDTNLDVAVHAFAEAVKAEPRARMVLAARTGPLRGELEKLVAGLGLEEVVAFHRAEWEDLPALVASADVLLSLPSSDSTPASLLEAMASGLPAVCGIAPSIEEWVGQGDGAELVPCRDEGAVAAALVGLLRDPERRRAYGERNGRVVREKIGDPGAALEELYRELVAA